ncbi:MAG: maleylpyruvate isomerase family mycothiol-dependent enzyme, partial [Pseudonocardia sp.]|nr:maleylpyruvate isomerase family mycothiol-dependent enzyme [Pseudonocardia sp.]
MAAPTDTMSLARAERADLADFLATLTPAQWDAPSLCDGWRVREVVAHMFSYDELSLAGHVRRFLRAGMIPARINAAGVAVYAEHSTDDLLALVRRCRRPRGFTACFGGKIALTDATIHHQDIRRPLGLPREIPSERLPAVLDFACTAPPIGASKRIRGLTLVATDLDWTAGKGPAVEGPAESLLMAIAGRRG